jgi:hypothetical protein
MIFTPIVTVPAGTFIENLKTRPFSFMAATSFEERSTAGAYFLNSHHLHPQDVHLFDYSTHVVPHEEYQRMHEKSQSDFQSLLAIDDLNGSIHNNINAFAFNRLSHLCSKLVEQATSRTIVVDITCMTRVHIFALSYIFSNMQDTLNQVYFCYTTPLSYGFQSGIFLSWRDILFVPISGDRLFRREGHARGIIFAGHYGDRLSVALEELEPASGRLIYTKDETRPDLLLKAREVNKFIEDRLLLLTMPRVNGSIISSDTWKIDIICLDDFTKLANILSEEIDKARSDEGPIMVYPFGPKPFTLFTAFFLIGQTDAQGWAVYPIPDRFDSQYSTGIGQLHIYGLQKQQAK